MVHSVKTYMIEDLDKFSTQHDEPTLLKGLANDWPAKQSWTPQFFRENFGNQRVTLSHYQSLSHQRPKQKFKATLAEYLDVIEGEIQPCETLNVDSYIAGWHFEKEAKSLSLDLKVPTIFSDNLLNRVNQEIINYDSTSLFIGHSRADTPLHTDSFAVCVWLANLVGKKIIRIVPPVDYQNIRNGMDAFDPKVVEYWSELGIPTFEAEIEAGDVFFFPPGYWHQVRNEGFTVAVSTNYISPYHFLTFEQQLRAKIIKPYLRLMKLKREIMDPEGWAHSTDAIHNFNFVQNETLFLEHLMKELTQEQFTLERVRQQVGV